MFRKSCIVFVHTCLFACLFVCICFHVVTCCVVTRCGMMCCVVKCCDMTCCVVMCVCVLHHVALRCGVLYCGVWGRGGAGGENARSRAPCRAAQTKQVIIIQEVCMSITCFALVRLL